MSTADTRLTLRTVGGFTGPAGAQTRSADLAALPAARAARLRQLLDACQLATLPAQLHTPQPHSWDFEYTLTLRQDGQTHTVRYHLDAAPPALRQLTELLNELPVDG